MNITLKLSLIPIGKLNAAIVAAGGQPQTAKAQAVVEVAGLIKSGVITLDQIDALAPYVAPKTAPTSAEVNDALVGINAAIGAVKTALGNDLPKLQKQVDAQGEIISNAISKSQQDTTNLIDAVKSLCNRVDAVEAVKQTKVSAADITKAVGKAVSAQFDDLREKISDKKLKAIASTVRPATTTKTAGEVFGAKHCTYDSIDFSDLEVEVWDHPSAPLVLDDYVFKPQHLHQALIALADNLPHNLWLAGERGTGKTEFATQIAARLKRPLFRVNFDEALERADFIGANTIEGGNVVWKPGIIGKAITQPGAIVLLDEIGFARAQSLAVLHSLCERSKHRALTVNETGERVPVADDVVFFCADNSNGHGDASGNFAGVREQNTAFIDRFSFTLEFEYLPQVDEAHLIASRTGVTTLAALCIVQFANVARQKAASGTLTQPPSLRQLFAWASACKLGLPLGVAFNNAIVNKYPHDCKAELIGIYASVINADEFNKNLGR